MKITERVRNAWNVFRNRNPSYVDAGGMSYRYRPDMPRYTGGKERSIITSILCRISVDCASIRMNHVKVDGDGRFLSIVNSGLNECLNVSANIDQTGRAFRQDCVSRMLDDGVVAIVPVDTEDSSETKAESIITMRAGRVLEWYPTMVKVELYNDQNGVKEKILVPKESVAIVENPFYAVMNSPNSMMQRLSQKLALLDVIDEKNSSGKLDLIIRLPYAVRGTLQQDRAETRRKNIEDQLIGSKYGIAYIDSTEQITQLNRPIENNLMTQIEFLTNTVYSQIGMTTDILNGTANEETMTNYNSRIVEPILASISDGLIRAFFTKTARTQGHTIMYFMDPFRLIPTSKLADIGDKMKRNEILSSNELRQILGIKPASDPNADKLVNSNIRQPEETQKQVNNNTEENQNGL